jgi:CDP-2,3-bis-(O-geranylgeranyl)-sn-glycerol synthase
MMHALLFALWFFWCAGVATMVPVFAAHLPGLRQWDTPMDFGRSWQGKRLLGNHKTWRGLTTGVAAGTFWFWVQILMYKHSSYIRSFCPLDFAASWALWIGFLLSLGAILGDALGSFFKRRVGINSGHTWFPVDQIDHIVGGLALSTIAVRLSIGQYLLILLIWFLIHLIVGAIGYKLKLKGAPL